MAKKQRCYVGLTDMITGMGFTHVKECESKTEARKYIREQGVRGIPKVWRGYKHWTIRNAESDIDENDVEA